MKVLCIFGLAVTVLSGDELVRQPKIGAGEGPAWDRKSKMLYFTGSNGISRREASGRVEVFRQDAGGPNGLLFDAQGRLVVCEAGNRRVVRLEKDGSTTVLADSYEGHRFNSPNDLTSDGHGRIYFSDPRYGSRAGMEMIEGVYRIDGPGKVVRVLGSGEVNRPNGVLVSRDGGLLYVADNNNDVGGVRKLWSFPLNRDGSVDAKSRKLIFDWGDSRGPDGMKSDTSGTLYVAAGLNRPHPPQETNDRKGGIYVLSPEGKLLRFIPITDDEVTNCAFGGEDGRTLFITAGGNLWSLRVEASGW